MALADDELGTFYLTDYLVRQFDTVFWKSMGLDRHPELLPMYFGHYKKSCLFGPDSRWGTGC